MANPAFRPPLHLLPSPNLLSLPPPIPRFFAHFPPHRISASQPPRFAYLISGTRDDGRRIRRLLKAIYHPRNYYILHLDLEASDEERLDLAKPVKLDTILRAFGNVMVIGKPDLLTFKGPTVMASTLHAVAVLLCSSRQRIGIGLFKSLIPLKIEIERRMRLKLGRNNLKSYLGG